MTQGTSKPRWFQFNLRLLLLAMLVVASFYGGWVANERFREAEEKKDANESAKVLSVDGLLGEVQIEFLPESRVLRTGGRPEDVERIQRIIKNLEAAAKE